MIHRAADMKTEIRERMRDGAGKVTIQHLFDKDEITAKTRLCARLTLPPKASIGMHTHEGEDELYVVISGSGWLDDGKTRSRVNAGDAILTGKGEPHSLINDGPATLDVMAVIMLYA